MTIEQIKAQLIAEGVQPTVTVLKAQSGPDHSLMGVKSRAAKRRQAKHGDAAHLMAQI